jgi:glycosyltransferase involved in cell wall biosynthesis
VSPRAAGARQSSPVVVQVVLGLGKGGLETMASELAVGLQARGLSPAVIALDEGGVQQEMLTAAGIPAHVIGGRRFREWSFHQRLRRLLRELRADVVHTHMFAPLIHMLPAIKLAGVRRLVHTEHSFEYLEPHQRHQRTLKWVSGSIQVFSLVGERMRRFYEDTIGIPQDRLRIIPNGIDVSYGPVDDKRALRAELGLPTTGFIVGSAGRLSHEKNFQDLLIAVSRRRASGGQPHLALFGEGAEREKLEQLRTALGLEEHVSFLGWRTDLPRLLGALDAFALCSNAEGLPLSVLEAMSAGLPSVCTPVGDNPVIVQNNRTGFLFAIGDVDALTGHLGQLEDCPELRRSLGSEARRLVETKYSRTTMIDRYVDAYAL